MENHCEPDLQRMRANGTALATACVTCGRGFGLGEEIACCSACGRFQHLACWEGNICPHADFPVPASRARNTLAQNQPAAVTRERVLGDMKRVLDERDDAQRANICIALVELGNPCRQHLLEIALDKSLDHYTRRLALKIASGFRDEALFEFIRSNCLAGKSKGALSLALGDDEESHSQLCLYITGEEILYTPDFFERFVAKRAVSSFGASYRPDTLPSRPAATAPSASAPPAPKAAEKPAPSLAQETVDAAKSGDVAAVRALLDKGADVRALLVQSWIQPAAIESSVADGVRRMRANRKALETVCVTCRRTFRFGEEVACCSACGRFQHAACWEGNTCPHADSAAPAVPPQDRLAGSASQPAPPAPIAAPVAVASEVAAPAPAGRPADQPAVAASEPAADERSCPKCGQIVKSAALKCRFCSAVLSERLAAAEMPAAVIKTIAGNARGALIYGLLGLVICAPIFASMAISSGKAALQEMDQYPLYDGPRGKARAGIVLGWLGWILLGIGILSRLPRN